MITYKKYISYLLYAFSVIVIIGVGLDTILLSGKYIITDKEVNIYGLVYYYQFLFLSIITWSSSYWLRPNKKLSFVYWLIFIIVTALVTL